MNRPYKEDHQEYLEIFFFTPSDYEKAGPAWPIRIGTNCAKPNYHIGPRISPYYYLLFVLEGEGTFHQSGQTYPLRPGDMFCLFPQVTHEYYTNPDAPLRKLFFAFDGKLALQLLNRAGLSPARPHIPGALQPEVQQLLEDFISLVRESDGTDSDLARLSAFLRVFDQLCRSAGGGGSEDGQSADWLQRSVAYMEIHYADGISIQGIADYAGVDRTHFSKQFHRRYGMAPSRYLQDIRMKEARLLLEQTGYRVVEIAGSVGYPDLFSFSKAFKKTVGVSPSEYRRDIRS